MTRRIEALERAARAARNFVAAEDDTLLAMRMFADIAAAEHLPAPPRASELGEPKP